MLAIRINHDGVRHRVTLRHAVKHSTRLMDSTTFAIHIDEHRRNISPLPTAGPVKFGCLAPNLQITGPCARNEEPRKNIRREWQTMRLHIAYNGKCLAS